MTALIDVDFLIEQARGLEPLPASVGRLASVFARADWDMDDVVEVVKYDQSLTARLLRVANSAASAAKSEVGSVRTAVMRLGTGMVLSIATGVGVRKRLQQSIPAYALSEGDLWRHSVASALAAELADRLLRLRVPPEAFTAALLHDVGKLVLGRYLDDEVQGLLRSARVSGGLDPIRAEAEILDVHHGEIGGLVVQDWGLPELIVKGVIYHHTPGDGDHLVCDVVHLANVVARRIGTGESLLEGETMPEVRGEVLERLGIDDSAVKSLEQAVDEQLDEVVERFS